MVDNGLAPLSAGGVARALVVIGNDVFPVFTNKSFQNLMKLKSKTGLITSLAIFNVKVKLRINMNPAWSSAALDQTFK